MKKILLKFLLLSFIATSCLYTTSCSSESDNLSEEPKTASAEGYSMQELEKLAADLEKEGFDVSGQMEALRESESQTKLLAAFVINSKKVSLTIPHPVDGGKQITVSGVLLYPKKHRFLKNMKLVVVTPGTYIDQDAAPSNFYSNLWTWQNSASKALAISPYIFNAVTTPVLIIDYPGFGDSNKKIQHPYLDQQILANTSIDLIREARKILNKNNVKLSSNDLLITGYSQGGFAATAITRAIETNPSNGDLTVKLLTVGGLPANLSYIVNSSVESQITDVPYFLPYMLWGYQKNRYPNISVQSILKEPYYTQSSTDFTGSGVKEYPADAKELCTEDFLKNYRTADTYKELRRAISENDLKMWTNSATFYICHGEKDTTVDYKQSKEFAKEMNDSGGKVTFRSIPLLGHALGFAPYWGLATADINIALRAK